MKQDNNSNKKKNTKNKTHANHPFPRTVSVSKTKQKTKHPDRKSQPIFLLNISLTRGLIINSVYIITQHM